MIYALKMDLLSSKIMKELPRGAVFAAQQQNKIQRFVQFFVFCYIPWWTTAPVPSRAPENDVLLIKSLQHYRTIDSICADSAMKSFDNHTWYLTEELVALALFSNNVDPRIKKKMVEKIMKKRKVCSKRFGSGYGKPKCPKVPRTGTIELPMFVGDDSWSLFEIMKLKVEGFINKPAEEWPLDEDYVKAKLIIDNVSVVNDSAERGVKLASDFLSGARQEENLQNILQVVENDRRNLPNQRKRKLSL